MFYRIRLAITAYCLIKSAADFYLEKLEEQRNNSSASK